MKHTLFGTLLICLCFAMDNAIDDPQEARGTPGGGTNIVASRVSSAWQRVTDQLYCGGEPAEFEPLASLGFTTVVSVDGVAPDVAAARRVGLRYVHIPMGYDGMDERARLSLTRLMQERDGPIYIHCHHGHHRAPVAAAIAAILAGELDHQRALDLLRRAGTSADFIGLWHAVETCEAPSQDIALPELVEVADVASSAELMAGLDRVFTELQTSQGTGWTHHPRLHEQAVLLREGLREFRRATAADFGQPFLRRLADAEHFAQRLERAVETQDWSRANKALVSLSASCNHCHSRFRD